MLVVQHKVSCEPQELLDVSYTKGGVEVPTSASFLLQYLPPFHLSEHTEFPTQKKLISWNN